MTRSTFTTITPLPSGISREHVVEFLHDHLAMIDLNPLIIERHQIPPPPHAPEDEKKCVWYSMTDRIDYLPGGLVSGQVSYTAAFFDSPDGLQTHSYAPMGLDLRGRWSVGGTMPGERPQPVELGLGAPTTGLYLREDVDMRCNMLMAGFVKKTIKKSHGTLVEKLSQKTSMKMARHSMQNFGTSSPGSLQTPTPTGSESSAVPPMGPLLPPAVSNDQRGFAPDLSSPPAYGHGTPSSSSNMGNMHPQRSGGMVPPGQPQRLDSNQSGLGHAGTVYRGNSMIDHYTEFSGQNPYDSSRTPYDERENFAELDDGTHNHPRHYEEKSGPAELA
ncbi:hypothetical protein FOPG_07050 [Fusarium oxysporum f. sp. conglutinans race 2 54008]|uniref:DUF7053 domain-containing protein n=3 Tax=Fusarium oxysporum f. sp. conglutinans TaxID=100902 RepID=F9FBQ0_FUSOF|nr:hypothetical protein FOXB_03827 [Fusarium oxysporum f. sp. conglutinans Fo5176]EXL78820.1 hypothetical protein FOPG_07050 [Fusarium oxysporum f. sp. conglutinans race 2 54008]KAI8409553.1 hypothetical protein FOFC_09393 [Fusarium oxysporum]WKT45789.1 hypothetical protein QSH57_010663 [Fusarium oxysporum f. sp. vasinfectum]KAJ4058176.1 hypothetical protein NW753_005846 [Fusarium oxysporum]